MVMKHAGLKHRSCRASLHNKYIKNAEGNVPLEPPPPYAGIIEVEHWREFVKKCTSDEHFLVYTITLQLEYMWIIMH